MNNMKKRCWTVIIVLAFLQTAAFGSVTLQEWKSADGGLLMSRQEVRGSVGAPDGTDRTTEWFDISGNEGLSRVTLDYLEGETVQAVNLAFRPGSIDLETLPSIVNGAFPGIPEIHRDQRMAMFLGRSEEGGRPVYFLALAGDPGAGKGTELSSMTESANRHYQEAQAAQ